MTSRRFPAAKPPDHVPPIPRWSARQDGRARLAVLFLGAQARDQAVLDASDFEPWLAKALSGADAPAHVDRATFVDPSGFRNRIAALYWADPDGFARWSGRRDLARWARTDIGVWWEPIVVDTTRTETIAFREQLRGLSACPFSRLEPITETGYWGAARDRIPASAHDRLDGAIATLPDPRTCETRGRHLRVVPPAGFAVIRSGQSWAACGPEQRASFEKHVRPKLDAGMSYLRENPVEVGCASLRQVDVVDATGTVQEESYALGAFVSLAHLERWAREHPSHLAIYHRALAERRKYQERLEFRTYNEIWVIDRDAVPFEYVNCHPRTGLLPFFA